MVNVMLPFIRDEAGALPIWTLAVLILGLAAVVVLTPEPQSQSTLEDGLGPAVETTLLRL